MLEHAELIFQNNLTHSKTMTYVAYTEKQKGSISAKEIIVFLIREKNIQVKSFLTFKCVL